MKTEQKTVTTIIADEGKLLRRKSDGWVAGERVTLGYNYYEGGVGLAEAKLETPENYEEFDKPDDYEEPQIINDVERILAGIKLLDNVTKRMEEEKENINTLELSDTDALKIKEMYPEWLVGLEVKVGERYLVGEDLWRVVKEHTTLENWKPGIETASLWERVEESHEGTLEDPIPYAPPMEIFEGKYYILNEIIYKCTRNSEIPLSYDLSALIGHYVETV